MRFFRSHTLNFGGKAQAMRAARAMRRECPRFMRASPHGLAHAAACIALLMLTACSEVLDIPDDPRLVDNDSEPWSCLGSPPDNNAPEGDMATVRVQACNFVSSKCSQPMTGLTVKVCDRLDLSCATPRQTISDNNGALEFAVPTGGVLGVGFDGYLRITPPQASCTDQAVFGPLGSTLCALAGPACDQTVPNDPECMFPAFVPAMLFFNPAVKTEVTTPIPLPLVPTAAALNLASAAGGSFNPTTGIVWTTSLDCHGVPAKDVALTIDKHQDVSTEIYINAGQVSITVDRTDDSGVGGFLGVPSGFVVVEGFLDTDDGSGRRIGEVGVNVEAFTISYTSLVHSE
jgi:hypothetical protein